MEPNTWRAKAFAFTEDEYNRAVDVPYKGYGGRLRDIQSILTALGRDFQLVTVGLTATSMQVANTVAPPERSLRYDASVLKYAQFFIGAEGGLANVAAGVGCRTVLTSDFVHQLYGPKGCLKRIPEPKLGPRYYFPDEGHIDLNPYLTDTEVLAEYQAVLSGKKTAADYHYEWMETHATV